MPRLMFLYGPSGAGKTVIGRSLAESLNLPYRDIDSLIESAAGTAIPDIFERESETGFRAREKSVLNSVISEEREAVVSLGGGALLDPENRARVEAAGEVLFADRASGNPGCPVRGRPRSNLGRCFPGISGPGWTPYSLSAGPIMLHLKRGWKLRTWISRQLSGRRR